MTNSEKMIEKSFDEYQSVGIARLMILFPKMRPAGKLGKMPAYVPVAKAPYDVAGYYYNTARFIAAEIKENQEHASSMPIIHPDKKGTGLQYHQLAALVEAHENGAYVTVLWDNGGEWLQIDGIRLKQAKSAYDLSMKAEEKGMPNAKGVRSIPAGHFSPIKLSINSIPLWLPENT